MKRILLASGLALAIHGYFLWGDFDRVERRVPKQTLGTVTITLSSRHLPKPSKPHEEKIYNIPIKSNPVPSHGIQGPLEKLPEKPREVPGSSLPVGKVETNLDKSETSNDISKEVQENSSRSLYNTQSSVLSAKPPEAGQNSETLKEDGLPDVMPPVEKIQDARPMYLKNPAPEYPNLARRRGYSGIVVLEVLVNKKGRVDELTLFASSGHEVLDKAAMSAVKSWVFQPGKKGDEAVDMWVKVPVRFELR